MTTSNYSSGGLETSQRFDMSSRGEWRRRALVWSIWTIPQASRSGIIEMFMVVFFCFFVDIDGQTIKTIIKKYFPFPRLILTMGSGSVFKQGKQNLCMKNLDLLSRRNRRRSWWTYCSRSLPLILCLMHPSLFYLPTRYHTQIIWLKLLILWCALVKFPLNWPGVKRGAGRQITKTWTEIPWDRGE